MRPFPGKGGYPLAAFVGEAGSGKSTATLYVHQLIDPTDSPLINVSADPRDYPPLLSSRHLVSYDNLSAVSDVISDLLARTATGATWATRRLNTNGDVYSARMLNPIILNGIPDTFGRADLQERMITIRLARVMRRKTDAEIEADFQRLHGPLLGLLLDGVSAALRNLPTTPVPDGIRMADAAQWAEAAAPGLGIEPGRLSAAWRANRRATQRAALDVDDLARAVVALIEKQRSETGAAEWRGEPTVLYERLCELAGERVTRSRAWPARPASMALHFKRIAGPLRDVHGIEVINGKGGRDSARWWSVRQV
jgi:hypothetical protein